MANTRSQIKRNRQAAMRHQRNKAVRSAVKTRMKRFDRAVAEGDRAGAEAAYGVAAGALDRAANRHVVHRNYAANHKSAMARRLSGL
ncbi:MAG: 30S ribosomal protein S20 [Actinomycetota bacterium]|nr:30S ribosomal protein S20 [Actinomycetota bacterium]